MATTTETGSRPRKAGMLLLLNTSMLLVHQIDAAFWHEWDMFSLPGGSQLNLLLNVPIVAFVVYGYGEAIRNGATSRHWTKINASLGLITLAIHTAFFMTGHAEFRQPASLLIFCAIALFSTLQLLGLETRFKAKNTTNRTPPGHNHSMQNQPSPETDLLRAAYAAFNARDIDAALATMSPSVTWPKAFKGGFVRGPQEVRAYWTEQWSEIDPHVHPVSFHPEAAGRIVVNVHQVVRDRAGTVLGDEYVGHRFIIEDGLIQSMEVCPRP